MDGAFGLSPDWKDERPVSGAIIPRSQNGYLPSLRAVATVRRWEGLKMRRRDVLVAPAVLVASSLVPAWARAITPLPDTEITVSGNLRAYLTDPTTRYDHAVLGDAIEAGGFVVEIDGSPLRLHLGADAVFEDRRVRLVEITGGGRPQALVVKAYQNAGAALALYRINGDGIDLIAESPAIGVRHRWLNPVGVGRFLGGDTPMIAAVITPHLAGSLRLYQLAGSRLEEVSRIDGFTNHIIGSRDLDLGFTADLNDDGVLELVLPRLDRRSVAVVSFANGPRVLAEIPFDKRIRTLKYLGKRRIAVGFEGGGQTSMLLPAL
jgi:hypothetical protein